jgi:hypothetical protein
MRLLLLSLALTLSACGHLPTPNPYGVAAAMQGVSQNYYRQQEIQAYNHRTGVMGLPQQHRHTGTFDVYHY